MVASAIFFPQWGTGMGHSTRRRVILGLTCALFVLGIGTPPTLADGSQTVRYKAFFKEVTTPSATCPPGAPPPSPPGQPPTAFCFTGNGVGTSDPPGGPALERYAGFVNFTRPITCPDGSTGFADHNNVTITTARGQIFLTTDGEACGLGNPTGQIHDEGVWNITGGNGIFRGATGRGTVVTDGQANPLDPSAPIQSQSTYTGTITLR
jgi:hypothetical protein